jgi:hypothetical protein
MDDLLGTHTPPAADRVMFAQGARGGRWYI